MESIRYFFFNSIALNFTTIVLKIQLRRSCYRYGFRTHRDIQIFFRSIASKQFQLKKLKKDFLNNN